MTIPKKNRWKNFKAVCFGIFLGLLLCEIILRIYNPFPFALKRGKLVLPSNIKTEYNNKWINKLDPVIYFSKNSLGFRGPEPNGDIAKLHSIIVVGGSTTECRFLSDSLTWPAQLATILSDSIPNLWLNNAGLDGHSTFGHLLLTKDYLAKLKPQFVIFLTGINDVETERPELFELMNEKKINFRDRNDCGAGILIGCFLFNGNNRRKPGDLIQTGSVPYQLKIPTVQHQSYHINALHFLIRV